jgi:hypothetical protein
MRGKRPCEELAAKNEVRGMKIQVMLTLDAF